MSASLLNLKTGFCGMIEEMRKGSNVTGDRESVRAPNETKAIAKAKQSASVEKPKGRGAVRSRAEVVSAMMLHPYKTRKEGEMTVLDLAIKRLGALVERSDPVSVRYAIDQCIGSPKAIITTEIDSPAVVRAACLLVFEMFGPDRVEEFTVELLRRLGEEGSAGIGTSFAEVLRPMVIEAESEGIEP